MRSLSRRPRGAAAVEFALVLPLLIAILFGTIEWGYYFYTREIVINSAREGARAGTLQGATAADATKAATDYLSGAGLALTRDGTSVAKADFTEANGDPCDAGSSCVRVEYTLPTLTGFLDALLGSPRTILAYSQMRK